MSPKLYELRPYKGTREVRDPNRIIDVIDFDDPEKARDLLRRHLLAAVDRDGGQRREAHLYHLDVHDMRGDQPERRSKHQYSLPVEW